MQPLKGLSFTEALSQLNKPQIKGNIRYLTYDVKINHQCAWGVEEIADEFFSQESIKGNREIFEGLHKLSLEEQSTLQKYTAQKENSKGIENIIALFQEVFPESAGFEEELVLVSSDNQKIGPIRDQESPFFGTDLVVYKNGAKNLPFEGITQKELAKTEKLYSKIKEDKTKFKIPDIPPEFRKFVLQNIKILLTRPTGRELINTLINSKFLIRKIRFVLDNHHFVRHSPSGKFRYIHLGMGESFVLEHTPKKNEMPQAEQLYTTKAREQEPFLALGHELIHCLESPKESAPPTLKGDFDTFGEQIAITGVYRANSLEDFVYSKINERILAQEFHRNSYPRANHRGGYFPAPPTDPSDIREQMTYKKQLKEYSAFVLEHELWTEFAKEGRKDLILKTLKNMNDLSLLEKFFMGVAKGDSKVNNALHLIVNEYAKENSVQSRALFLYVTERHAKLLDTKNIDGVAPRELAVKAGLAAA